MKLSALQEELKNLLIEIEEGVAIVKINRQQALNALNSNLLKEIRRTIECIEFDEEIRGVIITGSGNKAFIAGADVTEFVSLNAVTGREFAAYGQDQICKFIENLSKPVIAAVNGYCLGGGNELAMACDIRVASSKAVFGHPEVSLGIMPLYAGTKRLQRLVGFGRAKELILTSRMVKADEAYAIGLVNKVVEPDELLTTSKEMLMMMLSKAPLSIQLAKKVINRVSDLNMEDSSELERDMAGILFATDDKKEGVDAFLNKRNAEFKNC